MKYKVGDKVRINVLDERERYHKDLSYIYEMVKYQGQIHQITKVDTRKKNMELSFHFYHTMTNLYDKHDIIKKNG